MATKKKAVKAVKVVKPTKLAKTPKPKVFTEEETLRHLDEKGFNEMVGYAKHILERDGLLMATKALRKIIKLADKRGTGQGYATDVFAAAHSHWKKWNRDNPEG